MKYSDVRTLDLIWEPDFPVEEEETTAETTTMRVYSEDVAVHAEQTAGDGEVINSTQSVPAAMIFIPVFAAAAATAVIFAAVNGKKNKPVSENKTED